MVEIDEVAVNYNGRLGNQFAGLSPAHLIEAEKRA